MIIGKTRTNQPVEKEQGFDTAVEGLIQADKDIVANIVYDTESGNVIFPQKVLPLAVYTNGNSTFYFDYSNGILINEDGTSADVGIASDDGQIELDGYLSQINERIVNIDYVLFDVDFSGINTYNLYHTPAGGTKLYLHTLTINCVDDVGDSQVVELLVVSTSGVSLAGQELSAVDVFNRLSTSDVIKITDTEGYGFIYNPVYVSASFIALSYLGYEGSGVGIVTLEIYGQTGMPTEITISDTVTVI